jgi:hypothetical protein
MAQPLQPPLRAPLFTAEQMRGHGEHLAQRHVLDERPSRDRLLERLNDNQAVLRHAAGLLAAAQAGTQTATPAAEWLLDNMNLVEHRRSPLRGSTCPQATAASCRACATTRRCTAWAPGSRASSTWP